MIKKKNFALAVKNHQENNLDVATSLYNEVLKVEPKNIHALNNLGSIFRTIGQPQEAMNYFKKVIDLDPNFTIALYNLGLVFGDLRKNDKAIEFYKITIKLDPQNFKAHNNLGVIHEELGEYQKALNYYEKVTEINPNYAPVYNNLGVIYKHLNFFEKSKDCFEKAIAIDPNVEGLLGNIADLYIGKLDNSEKAINLSCKILKIYHKNYKFIDQSISLFKLKHDVHQANYLSSKDYKINGIDKFIKIGDEILVREENKEDENNYNKKVLLNNNEINSLLPYLKENHIYQTKTISGSCINLNKNWQDVEDEYFNSTNQIIYIDNFLSDEALQELRKFCLVSKVWYKEYNNKYLGAFSNSGFISQIHLQIASELKEKLPKLFGPHKLSKFWGFKYDSTLGKGINIHADAAIHNLNFWITPDKYNNNKNSGGLKVYDAPAPDNWTFTEYNTHNNKKKIYQFLEEKNANCVNVPYKFNRAVLFNSAYFHETDEIDFKDTYEGRRINNTYLFGYRKNKF